MPGEVATAYVDVRPDTTGFGPQLRTSVKRDVDQTEREFSRFGRGALVGTGALGGLGRAAAFASSSFIGGAGLVYAIKKSVSEAENQTQVLANLRNSLQSSGLSWRDYRKEIQDSTEATKRMSAFDDEELYASLQLLIRGTGSVTKALRLNNDAANLARGRNISLTQSALLLTKVYGGQIGAARRLLPFIDKQATSEQALAQIRAKYANAAEAYQKTAIGAQTELSVAIGDTEKAIGRVLLPTIKQYEIQLANWLNNADNVKRIQRDVNTVLVDGKQAVHGITDAIHLMAPPIEVAVKALGGLEHVVETAFILGIVLKARRAALAFGLIQTASTRTAAVVAATSAEEVASIESVGAAAVGTSAVVARVGAYTAATRAQGLASFAAIGGAAGKSVGKVGLLRSRLLGLGSISIPEIIIPVVISETILNSKAYKNAHDKSSSFLGHFGFLTDSLPKVTGDEYGRGKKLYNFFSGAYDGVMSNSDVEKLKKLAAAGKLSKADLDDVRSSTNLSDLQYNGLLQIIKMAPQIKRDQAAAERRRERGQPAAGSGAQTLTPGQQRQISLSGNPTLAALTAQRDHDLKALAFLKVLLKRGQITAADYTTRAVNLRNDLKSQQDAIDSINQKIAQDAKGRASKATARAAASKTAYGQTVRARLLELQNAVKAGDTARLYTLGGANPGLLKGGNIDLNHRKVAHNADGSISTVRTISIGTDAGETLIPTVINGKVVSDKEAIAYFRKTGQNLGTFATIKAANAYSVRLHDQQAALYEKGASVRDASRARLKAFLLKESHDQRLSRAERATYAAQLRSEKTREAQEDKKIYDTQQTLGEQRLQNAVALAQLHETLAGKNVKALKRAEAAERKADQALVDFYTAQANNKSLTAAQRIQARANAIAARQAKAGVGGGAGGTGAGSGFSLSELYASAAGEYAKYGSNIAQRGGVLSAQDERAMFAKDVLGQAPRGHGNKAPVVIVQNFHEGKDSGRAIKEARMAAKHYNG